MRGHDHEVFNLDYPRMVGPAQLQLLLYNGDPVCLGAGNHGIVVQAQSVITSKLYAVKLYAKGTVMFW
jgi:hypothetical protein